MDLLNSANTEYTWTGSWMFCNPFIDLVADESALTAYIKWKLYSYILGSQHDLHFGCSNIQFATHEDELSLLLPQPDNHLTSKRIGRKTSQ